MVISDIIVIGTSSACLKEYPFEERALQTFYENAFFGWARNTEFSRIAGRVIPPAERSGR